MANLRRRTVLSLLLASSAWMCIGPAAADELQQVTLALDWTPNTNHVGVYVAQAKGFYEEAGIGLQLLPYSDTSAAVLVASHRADFGITGSIALFTRRAAGADLKGVFAITQTETGRLVFDGERTDITRPRDLDGLIYGGFGSAWEEALIGAMIRHDGGRGEFEVVTLGTSAYDALATGRIDFTLEVETWEGVKAELDGRPQGAFRYSDFGVPDEHTTLIASSDAFLTANPEAARAFVSATRRGYEFSVEHPEEAAALLIEANPDTLTDHELVSASMAKLVSGNYLQAPNGAVGLFDPAKMEAIGSFLYSAGLLRDAQGQVLAEEPEADEYYTNTFAPPS